jgi:hypothetical protein
MSWPSWNSDTRLPLLLLSPSFQDGMATAGMRRRGGDAAARSDQHRERDGAVRVWSSRAGVGLDPTRSRACSARTSFANVASNVASDSGTAVIKMLSDPVLRNLLQLAPKLVVL